MANEQSTAQSIPLSILARLDRLLLRYEAGLISKEQLIVERDTLATLLKAVEVVEIDKMIDDIQRAINK